MAETVFRSGEALLRVLNDILDFSKIEAGKLQLESIDFDLGDNVEEVMELMAEPAHRKGLELVCQMDETAPSSLVGDPGRLRQILANLLGNAIKFTRQGEVVVRASIVNEQTDSVLLRFEVSDTGIGRSVEARRGIFDAFCQLDGSMSLRFGAPGLGLSIAKQLCEMMGGEIGVESTPGRAAPSASLSRMTKPPARNDPLPVEPLPQYRPLAFSLIVDDNATNRSVLRGQVDSWVMSRTTRRSWTTALEMMERGAQSRGNPPTDAVLLEDDDAGNGRYRACRGDKGGPRESEALLSSC